MFTNNDGNKITKHQEIRRQIHLPFNRALAISMRSIRNRLIRSIITIAGVFLAIAFITSILSASAITVKMTKIESQQLGIQAVSSASSNADVVKNNWLIVISLIVCGVGIANAMLMSVTERFQEIGTMKCLGALNYFIVELFLMESAFQGLVGASCGMFAGVILTFMNFIWKYGWLKVLTSAPIWEILLKGILAIAIGVLLSIVAAVYPAYRASKMMPADAMRTEI